MINYTELYHHGVKGQKWGIRRYQDEDGTFTEAGKSRYGIGENANNPNSMSSQGRKIFNADQKAIRGQIQRENGHSIFDNNVKSGLISAGLALTAIGAVKIQQYMNNTGIGNNAVSAALAGTLGACIVGEAVNKAVTAKKNSEIRASYAVGNRSYTSIKNK